MTIIENITPEIIGIIIGFTLRHFLMPFISGRETSDLIKYLKQTQMTKDQLQEIRYYQAEIRNWQDIHELACPYMHKYTNDAKNIIKNIANKGHNE